MTQNFNGTGFSKSKLQIKANANGQTLNSFYNTDTSNKNIANSYNKYYDRNGNSNKL